MFETKSGERFEIKDLGDGRWTITGYASTFGGQPDHTGDVVARGAFAESIATRPTKFLYQHADPIGVQLDLVEDQHGLLGTWEIVPTALGSDAHLLAKAGVLDSLSIGFITQDAEFRDDGVRVLKKVDLLEVSLVTFPANEAAVVTAVKARPFDVHSDDVRVAVAEWLERVRNGADIRLKEGRAISDSRRKRMATVSGSLRSAADEIDALLEETAPPSKSDDEPPEPKTVLGIDVGYQLALRRQRLRGRVELPA